MIGLSTAASLRPPQQSIGDCTTVNAHGYPRFTKDIDLVIELVPDTEPETHGGSGGSGGG